MLTYNQEKYISKAIESALNQDAEVRIIIGEDCSTDRTLDICKRYAREYANQIVILQSIENIGLVRNYKRCFEYCTSEFIAILEGDDYWIDKSKLSKQLEIFRNNKNIGFVHSDLKLLINEDNKIISKKQLVEKFKRSGKVFESLLNFNFIAALTVMFRRDLLKNIDLDFMVSRNFITVDFFLWQIFSANSELGYLNEETSVYRVLNNSIYHEKSIKKSNDIYSMKLSSLEFLYKEGYINKKLLKIKQNDYKYDLFIRSLKSGNYKFILKCFSQLSLRTSSIRISRSMNRLIDRT